MTDALDRLAMKVGVEPTYYALSGELVRVPAEAKCGVLAAMGIPADSDEAVAAALASVPTVPLDPLSAPAGVACHIPEWLKDGRCFGVGCQLYSLRSRRNWGIGDFEDLARFAEIGAAAGADFVGVNPLHGLFLADPQRFSPFSPSNRQFLNPLYIAIDRTPGYERMADVLLPPHDIGASELVDYPRVCRLKMKTLEVLFAQFEADDEGDRSDFERFVVARGQPLYLHALYETLSEAMAADGHGATWHGWPEAFRDPAADPVRAFAQENSQRIAFHSWLQWLADRQLAAVQARALAAGMRIGLYLDLAVGVAPDGSATWADRGLVVPTARIGAPPDYFNAAGQDWGLAPLSPTGLTARDFEPYRDSIDAVVRHAGALRIDHAMSLYRLFWIADGLTAAEGVYVRYPFHAMLRALAEVSRRRHTIIIGEDLGVVPPGFREAMQQVEIQSYRVFFFEQRDDYFLPPQRYPREALACVSLHDLPTLAGWWGGHDIDARRDIGMLDAAGIEDARRHRAHMRRRALGLLAEQGLLPEGAGAVMRGEADEGELSDELAVAFHRLVARTPSRLFVVQAEDLTGSTRQVNIPGTTSEHPNWRQKLAVDVEDLAALPRFRAITAALREERPKTS